MRIDLLAGAKALDEADWQQLDTGGDPFISRAFLGAAESSGAAGVRMGWQPLHLVLREDDGKLMGFLPLYLREHSFGDFSRDWNWAPAWQQNGRAYYPKLVSGVPYTPSPGPRLVIAHGAPAATVRAALIDAAQQLARETNASSWQCLFMNAAESQCWKDGGLQGGDPLLRRGVQFHWIDRGYRDFADFLDGFSAHKRKKVKRERRAVAEAGLRIEVRHGDEIDAALWPAIHRHYRDTFLRHGNHPAFPPEFFPRVGAALGPRMVLFLAWQGEQMLASSICYRDEHALYGRHWGADIDCPGLHFELCYYQGIEYALAHGLARFEPGAQGEHKLARGFLPTIVRSRHRIADPRFAAALRDWCRDERRGVREYAATLASHSPFKAAA